MLGAREGFRGDLLRWARTERQLTLRELSAAAEVAFSYLSELENGKKTEPHSDILKRLIERLGITHAFVRGHVPRYTPEDPLKCHGFAAEVGAAIKTGFAPASWTHLTVSKRCSEVLRRLIATPERPRLVVAYILGIGLESMEGFLAGEFAAPPRHLVQALAEVTTLPVSFFEVGLLTTSPADEEIHGLVEEIQRRGIPLEELRQWLRSRE